MHEDPRVTQPLHRRRSGQRIDALGTAGRTRTRRAWDVRLTHGRRADLRVGRRHGRRRNGTTPRSSAKKTRARAASLLKRLRDTLRAGRPAALRPGQVVSGRTAAALGTGVPLARGRRPVVARRPTLVAAARRRPSRRRCDALASPARLADALGAASATTCIPAYEDVRGRLLRDETNLPVNVDPLAAQSGAMPAERARLARQLDGALGDVGRIRAAAQGRGARRSGARDRWQSSSWPLRARAPVPDRRAIRRWAFACRSTRCRWKRRQDVERRDRARSVRCRRAACSRARRIRDGVRATGAAAAGARPPAGSARKSFAPPCASRRATARVHVFLPPLATRRGLSSNWSPRSKATAAELQAAGASSKAIRRRATRALKRLSRHARPRRHRSQHPSRARAGTSCVANTRMLYEEARQTRLVHREIHARRPPHRHRRRQPRHASAAPTPADSPLLRRPDLLRSLITLLAEPSVAVVSVLRACSSARRARHRASTRRATTRCTNSTSPSSKWTQQLRRRGRCRKPWLVDRLLRNLLDRRHRQHASRRVLASTSSIARDGRPAGSACSSSAHSRCRRTAQMSLLQMLLLRALIARFWKMPYAGAG